MKVADFGLHDRSCRQDEHGSDGGRAGAELNASGYYSLCHSNGTWEFYPPDQAAIEALFTLRGGAVRLPHAGTGGASKSQEVLGP